MVVPDDWSWDRIGTIAQYVLVLLIASIPVAMPAVMSVTMAIGAYALSKQKAIVSRLSAIDELAGVDVLCSDKTGTLTMNQLTLEQPIPYGDAHRRGRHRRRRARDARQQRGRDRPGRAARAQGPGRDYRLEADRVRALRSGQQAHGGHGRPTPGPDLPVRQGRAAGDRRAVQAGPADRSRKYPGQVAALAAKGYRALGVARSNDGKTWTLVGLLSLMDPPRARRQGDHRQTQKLGLEVKMVTGDDVAIGSEIAEQLGMGDHLLVASDIFKDGMPTGAAAQAVARGGRAGRRLRPRLPRAQVRDRQGLQELGHIVAMTGDGVNDAPALKQADCGMAVSGATDAARSAAALILTAPGLSTIINAIVEARKIFERIRSLRLLPHRHDARHHGLVVGSIVLFDFQPLTAIMIVALALLDDIPIMTIAYDNVRPRAAPVRWKMHAHPGFLRRSWDCCAIAETFGLLLVGPWTG